MIFYVKIFILHSMFDCSGFLNRMGWVQRELSQKLECSQSTVAMWSSGKNAPPYPVILKLIELGATKEELFGEKHSRLLDENSKNSDSVEKSEFKGKVAEAMKEIISGDNESSREVRDAFKRSMIDLMTKIEK